MGGLQRFEQRLEQAISGVFARTFRSAVQPVEIAAALQRELDNKAQIVSRQRRMVPNSFHVELSASDLERMAGYTGTLADELRDQLKDHADQQGYVFPGSVRIDFAEADDLSTGRFRVLSRAEAAVSGTAPPARSDSPARASIEVNGTQHPLVPPGLVVGRGSEADIRINDPGVSRRHAQFLITTGAAAGPSGLQIEVHDMGSTNGIRVDGQKVSRAALRSGSRVQIGHTSLTVRLVEGGAGVELTLFLIRIAYLAILWIFVLSAISVIRSDMFGARMPSPANAPTPRPGKEKAAPKPKRGTPTHVAVVQGPNSGITADLAAAPVLIGRGNDAAIKLDDDYVSTRHARIVSSNDQWYVEDLGSTNGTYLGSQRITQPVPIGLGSQVRIGKTIVELRK